VSRNKTNVNYDAAIVGANSIGAFLPIFSAVLACGCCTVPAHGFALIARALGIGARLVPANR